MAAVQLSPTDIVNHIAREAADELYVALFNDAQNLVYAKMFGQRQHKVSVAIFGDTLMVTLQTYYYNNLWIQSVYNFNSMTIRTDINDEGDFNSEQEAFNEEEFLWHLENFMIGQALLNMELRPFESEGR